MQINSLNWTRNSIISLAGILSFSLLTWWFVIEKSAYINNQEKIIETERDLNNKYKSLAKQIEGSEYSLDQEIIEPERDSLNLFLGEITDFIAKTNNKSLSIQVMESKKINKDIEKYTIEVCTEGKYGNIIDFLRMIEGYQKYCRIEKITIEEYNPTKAFVIVSFIPSLKECLTVEKRKILEDKNDPFSYLTAAVKIKTEKESSPNLKYSGFIDQKERYALIYDGSKSYIAKQGDVLSGSLLVEKIDKEEVILVRNNKKIVLRLTND